MSCDGIVLLAFGVRFGMTKMLLEAGWQGSGRGHYWSLEWMESETKA